MPKTCECCQYYSTADAETTCPACGTPLRFTLLPPANTTASYPPETADGNGLRVRTGGPSADSAIRWLTGTKLGLAVLVLAATVLFRAGWDWAANDPTGEADSTGHIRTGMAMSDVVRIIETGPVLPPPGHRLSDNFPPGNRSSGELVWREDGRWVRITFSGGKVTGVRDEPGGDSGFGNTGRRVMFRID